jgi:hypothetical protein
MRRWIADARRFRLNCTGVHPGVRDVVGAWTAWALIAVGTAGSAGVRGECADAGRCGPVRVWVRFASTPDVDASLMESAVHELAAVWLPNNVEVLQYADHSSADVRTAVALIFSRTPPPVATHGALGWVNFVESNLPLPVLYVSLPATHAVLEDGRLLGTRTPELPRPVRMVLFARALGRAAAHELGHYLLASARHSATGLMRLRFTPDELIDDRRGPFRLPQPDRLALAARMPGQPSSCPSER